MLGIYWESRGIQSQRMPVALRWPGRRGRYRATEPEPRAPCSFGHWVMPSPDQRRLRVLPDQGRLRSLVCSPPSPAERTNPGLLSAPRRRVTPVEEGSTQTVVGLIKLKVRGLLRPGNQAPWPEVRDQLNSVLRGWSHYFGYGTRLPACRAVDNYVYERVRHFLVRRHKVPSRGTTRFSAGTVFGDLGVLRLRRVHLGPPPCASG